MLTTIGKNLVYITVIFSVTALGLSLWAVADRTDFDKRSKEIQAESKVKRAKLENEKNELTNVVGQLQARNRPIPRGPDEIAANKDVTIAEANKQADEIEKQLADMTDKMQVDIQARISLINEMQLLRQKVQTAKDEGAQLRLITTPDENLQRQGHRSFRDIVASLQVATEEADRRTEAMQPDLYNAAIRLQNLEKRLGLLQERARELGLLK
jgi:hypothetical protein